MTTATMTTAATSIVDEIIRRAKAGTTTYGEAIDKLHIAMKETPSAEWPDYDAALSKLLQEMRSQPHGLDPSKPFD